MDNIENDVERKKQSIEDGLRGRADVRDLARRCNFFVCFALCQGLRVVDASWINPFSFDSRSDKTSGASERFAVKAHLILSSFARASFRLRFVVGVSSLDNPRPRLSNASSVCGPVRDH